MTAGRPGRPGGRPILNRNNFHRLYAEAVDRTGDPATGLGLSSRLVLAALRTHGPQSAGELAEQIARTRRLRPATVTARLAELHAAGLVFLAGQGDARHWSAAPVPPGPLAHLRLSGPHDLRHTFATWLEDAGIPARVIDELMGHAGGRRSERGSTIGRAYRHTTAEMRATVVSALQERLTVVLQIAEEASCEQRDDGPEE
jgi:hypothetical protein